MLHLRMPSQPSELVYGILLCSCGRIVLRCHAKHGHSASKNARTQPELLF